MIAEDKRWLQVRDDYYHYLKEHGLRKLHGNEHEGYLENRGAIINRLPWEHNVDRFMGREHAYSLRITAATAPLPRWSAHPRMC